MPTTYSSDDYPIGRRGRMFLIAWSLLLLGGFLLASRLDPDPRGYGTHQRLGLPPCSLRMMFGIPCPSCGMTTSFAHFTRGAWGSALRANSGGALLALFCALQIPWCWWSAVRGRLWKVSRPAYTLAGIGAALAAVTALHWLLTIFHPV